MAVELVFVFVYKATTFRNIFSYVLDQQRIRRSVNGWLPVLPSLWNPLYLLQPSLRVLVSRTGLCYTCVDVELTFVFKVLHFPVLQFPVPHFQSRIFWSCIFHPAFWSRIFRSCIFHSCIFGPAFSGTSFSGPAFSSTAFWSLKLDIIVPSFSGPAFSAPPSVSVPIPCESFSLSLSPSLARSWNLLLSSSRYWSFCSLCLKSYCVRFLGLVSLFSLSRNFSFTITWSVSASALGYDLHLPEHLSWTIM